MSTQMCIRRTEAELTRGAVPLRAEVATLSDAVPIWMEGEWRDLDAPSVDDHRNSVIRIDARRGVVHKFIPWTQPYLKQITREIAVGSSLRFHATDQAWPHHVHSLGPVTKVECGEGILLHPPMSRMPLFKLLDWEWQHEGEDGDDTFRGINSVFMSLPSSEILAFCVENDTLLLEHRKEEYNEVLLKMLNAEEDWLVRRKPEPLPLIPESGSVEETKEEEVHGGRVPWDAVDPLILPLLVSPILSTLPLTDHPLGLLHGLPSLQEVLQPLMPVAMVTMQYWPGHSMKSAAGLAMLQEHVASHPIHTVLGVMQQVVLHTGWVQDHGVAHMDAHLGNWLMQAAPAGGWCGVYKMRHPDWAEETTDGMFMCDTWHQELPGELKTEVKGCPVLLGLVDWGAAQRRVRHWRSIYTRGKDKTDERGALELHAVGLHRTLYLLCGEFEEMLAPTVVVPSGGEEEGGGVVRAEREAAARLVYWCKHMLRSCPNAGVYWWTNFLETWRRKLLP